MDSIYNEVIGCLRDTYKICVADDEPLMKNGTLQPRDILFVIYYVIEKMMKHVEIIPVWTEEYASIQSICRYIEKVEQINGRN